MSRSKFTAAEPARAPGLLRRHELSRRTVLRGLGTAVALPWLEAMVPFTQISGRLRAAESARPQRFVFLFFPNGTHHEDWAPTSSEQGIEIPELLAPLKRHREEVTFFRGLSHRNARALGDGPGDHARSAASFLTGAHPHKTAGANIRCGTSIDQVLAREIGGAPLFPSLQLGCEGGRQSGQCDSGYACSYSSTISWADPHTPLVHEIEPRQLLDRLFLRGPQAETARAREERFNTRKSILDYVREDAKRLNQRLGVNDRRKMDAYLTGIRELERRIEMAERVSELEAKGEGIEVPDRIPREYGEHVQLQMELLILALRLDLTRVATFMIANEGSNRSFPNLDVRDGHHHLSHHRGNEGKIEAIRKINRYQSELLAHFLDRMRETDDEGEPLLNSSLVLWGCAIRDGNRHDHDDLPILLAGRGGGVVTPGQLVETPRGTPMCDLYLRMLQWSGASVTKFGDSQQPLQLG